MKSHLVLRPGPSQRSGESHSAEPRRGLGWGLSALRLGGSGRGWGLGGGGCGTAGRGDLQGEGPTDAWRVTGLLLEAGGFRGSPSRSWPYCQYVSSWAWGSHFLALGYPCWWPSFLPCLHYAVTFSHRGSIWSLCQPDWLIRAALHVSGRGGGELAHPQRSRPPTGLHHLQNWT